MGQAKKYQEQEEHKRQVAEMIALETKAINPCEFHSDIYLYSDDEDATKSAYQRAAKGFKNKEYSEFKNQRELTDLIKEVIEYASEECYSCSKW